MLLGWQARVAAFVMFLYLAAVSVLLHNFWALHGPAAGGAQTQFLKNVGIMGGRITDDRGLRSRQVVFGGL